MPFTSTQQPAVLEGYVREILERHGFNELPLEDQESVFFDFVEQALIRLGAGLSPFLNDEGKKNFKTLLNKQDASQEEWFAFWKENVPEFDKVAQKVLEDFSLEVKQAFIKAS